MTGGREGGRVGPQYCNDVTPSAHYLCYLHPASNPAARRAHVKELRPHPFETDSKGKLVITEDEGRSQRPAPPPSALAGEDMEVDQKVAAWSK